VAMYRKYYNTPMVKRILLVGFFIILGTIVLQASVAKAEYCYNGPNRPRIGTADVFWGDPPSPYSDITLSGGLVARMSLEGTFPGDSLFYGQDCEGEIITVQIFSDGNPSTTVATVSGSLVSGSMIQPGNLGTWQWYVDWPHNLYDGRYRFKVIAINGFAINNGRVSSNLLIITNVGSQSQSDAVPLTCGLTANPASGTPPLNNVDMTVAISSSWDGTAHEYNIDCTNDGIYEGTQYLTTNPYTFVDACNYPVAGSYNARGRLRNLYTLEESTCSLAIVSIIPTPTPAPILNPPILQPVNPGIACTDNSYSVDIVWTGDPNSAHLQNSNIPEFYVDVSTDNFSSYWNKQVNGATSTQAPSGFVPYTGVSGNLVLNPGTTYQARVFNGATDSSGQQVHSNTVSFSVPTCPTPPPITPLPITPPPTTPPPITPPPVTPPPITPPPVTPGPQGLPFTVLIIRNPFSGNIDTMQDLFDAVITFLYYVAGPIVVIMIILAGLFFLFARDQADKINTAKKILTYALIGFAIILIGRGFIALIESILALGG